MASPIVGLDIQKLPVQQEQGQETTKDDPKTGKQDKLSAEDQQELIKLVRKYKQQWSLARRMIIKRVLKAHEFFKGNQFISFDPESFQWFDALEATINSEDGSSEDLQLYQFATNFYQMLGFAFIAALSAQVPKTRALPENAEREEDIATAKAFSTVQEIIERKNNIKSLHKQALLEFWMSGCYFRHTRYVVDGDRAGTHKEPSVQIAAQTLMPARYVCPKCATTIPATQAQQSGGQCPKCGNPLTDQDFFPEEKVDVPVAQDFREVANGMVKMDIYGPLHVDAHPRAKDLTETPILNLDMELSVAVLRTMYPEKWEALRESSGGMLPENQEEKIGRSMLYSEGGSRSQFMNEQMPTYSRTWIQPWAFADIDDKTRAEKLSKLFPEGALLCNIGDTFLDARPAKLTKEWSHCGTVKGKFGLYPPAVGDAAIPVQERVNDTCNITHEYMDRLAAGILLANEELLSTNNMNGKALQPGTITGMKMPKALGGSVRLSDQIFQVKAELDSNIYNYTDKLVFWMQLLVGTPPQIFGGAGDPHVETKGGQEQQLSTAMGKLGGFWDETREENANAAELAVNCAKDNMNDDWFDVVTDTSGQFRNQYVYLDDMRGSIHAYPETDQGFPMSHAEIKAFWDNLIEYASSGKNPYANAVLDEPANQEQIAIWTGVPGLVVPGREMRNKAMQIIDRLMKQPPNVTMAPVPNPADGGQSQIMQPITMPSIQPDPLVDDMGIYIQVIKEWAWKNWTKADDDPEHWANVMAFLKLCVQYKQKDDMQQAMAQAAMSGGKQPQQGDAQ